MREKLFAVHSLTATAFGAFAALKTDGSVASWANIWGRLINSSRLFFYVYTPGIISLVYGPVLQT